ncbi:DUF2610 domain-containing protein [Jiella sonneratiae]|uniref:DUF2610 domain-containing protein n=1 Tax=Jiella sonneratiae TaxID=2816856 RepID=A0ABS3IYW7_9HYPH|nr:DUF2610 domain-containing protein [Jiella sonneratiae]MBO0902601.1 DUF2610 domain-containing protein [Jiella sonneratiae]
MKYVLAILALLLAAATFSPAAAEERIALVIGNDRYEHLRVDSQLERAGRDAAAIGNALETIGFRVLRGSNLDRRDMLAMIRRFRATVKPGDVALFFFAGHGVAIDGTNYLLPTDIRPTGKEEIAAAAVPETRIESDLLDAGAKTGVLVLDACRNNPFGAGKDRSLGRSRGLDASHAVPGIFKLFSAGTGQAAIESLGEADADPNSLFTRILAAEIKKPGQSLIDLTYAVKRQVLALSGNRQNPAYYDGGFAADVYLAGRGEPEAPQALSCSGAGTHFAVAQKLGTRAALEAHLGFYGHCPYAPFAKALLDSMEKEGTPQAVLADPPSVEGAAELAKTEALVRGCGLAAASPRDAGRPEDMPGVALASIDAAKAIPACEAAVAARPEDPRLAYQLGRALSASPERRREAAAAFGKAADRGFPLAQTSLGRLYAGGIGVPRDVGRAVDLYRKAAVRDDAVAQFELGQMYEKGLGLPRNLPGALTWYERAAENGSRAAHGAAARILTDNASGFGRTGDYARAADHWREAARGGDAEAAFKLAIALRDGQIEANSEHEMMDSFDAAARTGRADALIALARIHLQRRHNRDALDLAYRAYDIASKAPIDSENGWLPLQFISASLVVKIVRQARLLPRSQREFDGFRNDFSDFGFRRFTVPATCDGETRPFSIYAWDWSRDHDMVGPQLEWLAKARGCKVPAGIAEDFGKAFADARKRNVGYADLILSTLHDVKKETTGAAADMP